MCPNPTQSCCAGLAMTPAMAPRLAFAPAMAPSPSSGGDENALFIVTAANATLTLDGAGNGTLTLTGLTSQA
jgi:hypothetical protein